MRGSLGPWRALSRLQGKAWAGHAGHVAPVWHVCCVPASRTRAASRTVAQTSRGHLETAIVMTMLVGILIRHHRQSFLAKAAQPLDWPLEDPR